MECATSGALDAKESAVSAAQAGLAAAERVPATEAPINVRRFMGGILPLWEGKGTGVQRKKKGDPTGSDRPPGLGSELEAQAKLHAARRMCTAGMEEARTADTAWVTCRAGRSDAVHATVNAV